MKKQTGFTLIELIMVIVILGILAATALPKFANLGTDAKAAAIKAVEGSMRATNAIIYAKAAVGNALQSASSITVDNVLVNTVYGFGATASYVASAMDLSTDFSSAVAGEIEYKTATTPGNCKVVYTPATSNKAPVYTTDTTGC